MELTPQALHDVEFREARRGGYNTRDVDDFLERVAMGVGQLQDRLREAYHRAEAAEARHGEVQRQMDDVQRRGPAEPPAHPMSPAPSTTETDETLRRTLVLAQRTADATIKEAQEEANRLLSDAEGKAAQVRASAETEALRDARVEVDQLVDSRETLLADIEKLERFLDDQRAQIRTGLGELQRLIDESSTLRMDPTPEITDVSASPPAPVRPPPAAPTPETLSEPSGNGNLASSGGMPSFGVPSALDVPTREQPSVAAAAPAASAPSDWDPARPDHEPVDHGSHNQDASVVGALQELHRSDPPSDDLAEPDLQPGLEPHQRLEPHEPFDSRPPLEAREPLEPRPPLESREPLEPRPPLESREPLEPRPPLPQRAGFQAATPPAAAPQAATPPAAPPSQPGGSTGFLPDLRAAFDPPPERDDAPAAPTDDLAPIDAPPPPPPPAGFDHLSDVGGIPIEPGSRPSEWGRGVFDTDDQDEEEPRFGNRR